MSSVSEIIKAFTPVLVEVENLHIRALVNKLNKAQFGGSRVTYLSGVKLENLHLSGILTLSDLKTAIESCDPGAKKIITYLKLQQNIDQINESFPFIERIQAVSHSVLNHVSLSSMQLTGFSVDLKDSPVCYALAPDQDFLNQQVHKMVTFDLETGVAAARIQDIERQNPQLFDGFRSVPFSAPWFFQNLDLTIGKLRYLSANELNSIATKLPPSACGLFSEDQVRSVNFNLFSAEQLDKMVGGDETDEDITRRLGILNPGQTEIFLNKSSACHFNKFSDSFYETLPLSKLNRGQVSSLFDTEHKEAQRHLHLVSPGEISKGLHLFSEKALKLLSDQQIESLNYSTITAKEVEALFMGGGNLHRVRLIPSGFVNGVISENKRLSKYLSRIQYLVLDTTLLDQKTVCDLFPGFTLNTLHPGYTYAVMDRGPFGMQHEFTLSGSKSGYSKVELDAKLQQNRNYCSAMAKNFSTDQLLAIKPMMYPEVQQLLSEPV